MKCFTKWSTFKIGHLLKICVSIIQSLKPRVQSKKLETLALILNLLAALTFTEVHNSTFGNKLLGLTSKDSFIQYKIFIPKENKFD